MIFKSYKNIYMQIFNTDMQFLMLSSVNRENVRGPPNTKNV